MARYFTQKDIDVFRECFSLYAQQNVVTNPDQLLFIMRSLGYSPTRDETLKYYQNQKGKVDFAIFLEILYKHSQKESPADEILAAFKAHDRRKTGLVPARELRSILMAIGEKLTAKEVDAVLQECNVAPNGQVRYADFVKLIASPVPDYF